MKIYIFIDGLFGQEWPHDSYPPWAHGPGYVISRDIAKFIVRGHQERNLKVRLFTFRTEHIYVYIVGYCDY